MCSSRRSWPRWPPSEAAFANSSARDTRWASSSCCEGGAQPARPSPAAPQFSSVCSAAGPSAMRSLAAPQRSAAQSAGQWGAASPAHANVDSSRGGAPLAGGPSSVEGRLDSTAPPPPLAAGMTPACLGSTPLRHWAARGASAPGPGHAHLRRALLDRSAALPARPAPPTACTPQPHVPQPFHAPTVGICWGAGRRVVASVL